MTVPSTDSSNSFTGDGATKAFSYTFRATDTDQIQVYVDDVLQGSGYSVRLDSSGVGGTVTFTGAPADGADIYVTRDVDLLQEDHLEANAELPPATIERMVDKLHLIAQQLSAELAQCLHLAATISGVDTELPTPVAGELLRWNSTATAMEGVTAAEAFNDSVSPGDFDGNIVGPESCSDGAVPLWDGTNGKLMAAGVPIGSEGDLLTVVSGVWAAQAPAAIPPAEEYVPPSGTLWFGLDASHIPSGYELCDGRTVTINGASFVTTDVRGLMLVAADDAGTGANGGYTTAVGGGDVGGTKNHTHTQAGTFSTSSTSSGSAYYCGSGGQACVAYGSNYHGHYVTLSGNTSNDSNRPRTVALVVAIKVDE